VYCVVSGGCVVNRWVCGEQVGGVNGRKLVMWSGMRAVK
jgi:hypothetical protein